MRAMSFPPVSFGAISVDARDPGAVAAFWVDLIGGRIAGQNDEAAIVVAPGYPVIEFFKVEEAKAAKNRVHIDVLAADLETATSRAVALGAVEVTEGPLAGPFRWKVLTDPEGNEFCICPLTPDGAPPSHPAFRVMAAARGFSAALGAEPDDALRRRPAPDEWSAIEVAGHVVDKLRTWTQRIARTVSEERPAIVPYDQDALVLALDHHIAQVDAELNNGLRNGTADAREDDARTKQIDGLSSHNQVIRHRRINHRHARNVNQYHIGLLPHNFFQQPLGNFL